MINEIEQMLAFAETERRTIVRIVAEKEIGQLVETGDPDTRAFWAGALVRYQARAVKIAYRKAAAEALLRQPSEETCDENGNNMNDIFRGIARDEIKTLARDSEHVQELLKIANKYFDAVPKD